jgi:hypothetical protein
MKANEYYRTQFRRENVVKLLILSFFRLFASGGRLLLEVFIRKNFGERYFKLSYVIFLTIILAYLPFYLKDKQQQWASDSIETEASYTFEENFDQAQAPVAAPSKETTSSTKWPGWGYALWYVYLAAFLGFSIKHQLDKGNELSVFDFKKFSLSSGQPQDYMARIPYFKGANRRIRECYLEPALFLIIGFVLAVIGQYIGWLLIICSMFYCASYFGAYEEGDNFIMDTIDEMIANKAMESDFVQGADYAEQDSFVTRAKRPNGENYRRQILPRIIRGNDTLTAQ